MTEVQFVAELSMSLVDGLQDFSAARVDKAYARWDEDFPERSDVEERLERIFSLVVSVKPDAIRDTIASRVPVFYSLVLVLDELEDLPSVRSIEDALWELNGRFNDERPATERPEEDLEFVKACTASTQRIRSRRVRHAYIKSFLE